LEFQVEEVAAGGATTVTLYLRDDTAVNAYYKYGPTPDDATPHWYEFAYNGATGAEIFADIDEDSDPEVIVLHFVDGARGDDDLTANGRIVDPGSPALRATAIQIDVKPGSDDSLNLNNEGKIEVAILTTAAFNPATIDINSVRFAFASVYASTWKDVDNDGDQDLVLTFRTQDTNLRPLYERLLADDINADGVLDSNHQEQTVSLTGETVDSAFVQGFDDLDLFLSLKSLRSLLDALAAAGAI
jgi:hypothetical protein